VPGSLDARSPYALLDEVERARDVLILTYTASLEFFERFALSDARALGALVTVISDATMVRADPMVVRRAGVNYLDARAVCPGGTAFHPKLLVIVGDSQARVAIGSGNLTMAGWHGNAETWTVLRADEEGGPTTLREVSTFLRRLSDSEIALSAGAPDALRRVATELDELPADEPGPRLLDSLQGPILDQLASSPETVEELVLYSPFHDARLSGARALLDRLEPAEWTVFVQPDTVVDGPALQALTETRGGRIAWISRRPLQADGSRIHDERYWHGKVAQWRTTGGQAWTLTGSPNLSAPALLRPIGGGGNCELAVLSRINHDLTPPEGDPPAAGLALLVKPAADADRHRGPVLLSAVATGDTVMVQLHGALGVDGTFERYDLVEDRWTTTATVDRGSDCYNLDLAAAPIARALRLRTADGLVSNEVFVADPDRLRRRQQQAVGKVRRAPDVVAREGLGAQLLDDIEELRGHLLAVGATIRVSRGAEAEHDGSADEAQLSVARPALGQSLEEFLEACDPVLGRRMTEFALVLPALPGVGAALDDEVGTLDSDTDETATTEGDADREHAALGTIREELSRQRPDERRRYRSFVERLVERAPGYPLLVRNLTLRTLLHAIAASLWPDDEWPPLLAEALCALAAAGDESRPEENAAAGSLAAVGLALLRTDVPRMSVRDEHQIRYVTAATTVAGLLDRRDPQQVELLAAELPGRLAGPVGAQAAQEAVEETLNPPRGVHRAVRLLAEEHDIHAATQGDATIVIQEPLADVPEFTMILALRLADEPGPVFARGATAKGHPVLAAWCAPWLAVERVGKNGRALGRAWDLGEGQTLHGINLLAELPRADRWWNAGEPRPQEVRDLLAMAEHDSPAPPHDLQQGPGQLQP
jgi:hypothetical protein